MQTSSKNQRRRLADVRRTVRHRQTNYVHIVVSMCHHELPWLSSYSAPECLYGMVLSMPC